MFHTDRNEAELFADLQSRLAGFADRHVTVVRLAAKFLVHVEGEHSQAEDMSDDDLDYLRETTDGDIFLAREEWDKYYPSKEYGDGDEEGAEDE